LEDATLTVATSPGQSFHLKILDLLKLKSGGPIHLNHSVTHSMNAMTGHIQPAVLQEMGRKGAFAINPFGGIPKRSIAFQVY
jgi:hypothetical protein